MGSSAPASGFVAAPVDELFDGVTIATPLEVCVFTLNLHCSLAASCFVKVDLAAEFFEQDEVMRLSVTCPLLFFVLAQKDRGPHHLHYVLLGVYIIEDHAHLDIILNLVDDQAEALLVADHCRPSGLFLQAVIIEVHAAIIEDFVKGTTLGYLHSLELPCSLLYNIDAKGLRRFLGEEELRRKRAFKLVLVPVVVILLHATRQWDRISVNVDNLVHI